MLPLLKATSNQDDNSILLIKPNAINKIEVFFVIG
jgi:hypothetical protein